MKRRDIEGWLFVAKAAWVIFMLGTFYAGIVGKCETPVKRVELLVPGRVVGCFLQEPLISKAE